MPDNAAISSAEAFLSRLKTRGIDYVFANPGTDFAPIIEALSKPTAGDGRYPQFITVPHENVAIAMAHGYYRTCGKMAAVMVHVTVGTANAACGLMNAARDNVPVLLCAGRSPATECGHIASRDRSIHWGQEAFDQAGMVREYVKWDYELRHGQPIEAIVDRALDISMTEPCGPTYLVLPREVLADPSISTQRRTPQRLGIASPVASNDEIRKAAIALASAKFPIAVTSSVGRDPEAANRLSELAGQFSIPIVQHDARDCNISHDHEMAVGFDAAFWIRRADAILVVDSIIPWIPKLFRPNDGANIIHIGRDPIESRYAFRDIDCDQMLAGDTASSLALLADHLASLKMSPQILEDRRAEIIRLRQDLSSRHDKLLDQVRDQSPIHLAYLAHCINEVKGDDTIVVNELGVPAAFLQFSQLRTFIGNPPAGGLGFALGAGLGAKLAAPERDVIVAVGDGSYMFGNPLPYHFVSNAEKLPTLTVISNNSMWGAVREATLDVYPNGSAKQANVTPLVSLNPSPSFEAVIGACGGYGKLIDSADELLPALKDGMSRVRAGQSVLLNVITRPRRS